MLTNTTLTLFSSAGAAGSRTVVAMRRARTKPGMPARKYTARQPRRRSAASRRYDAL